eukprot:3709265-Rhodomonas_salina.1
MTTIDCAIFDLQRQAPAHTLPFEDEWTGFRFTRTASGNMNAAPMHAVSEEQAFTQDPFDVLRLCSGDRPAEEHLDIGSLQSFQPVAHHHNAEDFTLPMMGSDAPQGQKIAFSS